METAREGQNEAVPDDLEGDDLLGRLGQQVLIHQRHDGVVVVDYPDSTRECPGKFAAVEILRYASEKAGGPPHEIDVPFQRVCGVQFGAPQFATGNVGTSPTKGSSFSYRCRSHPGD